MMYAMVWDHNYTRDSLIQIVDTATGTVEDEIKYHASLPMNTVLENVAALIAGRDISKVYVNSLMLKDLQGDLQEQLIQKYSYANSIEMEIYN